MKKMKGTFMRVTKRLMTAATVSTLALALVACAPDDGGSETPTTEDSQSEEPTEAEAGAEGGDAEPIDIGIIYSKTGPLAAYGENYIQALHAGIDYATDGTGIAGGYEINFTIVDDGGDASKAVTAFKDMVGEGVPIIAGTTDSGIAMQLAPLAEQNQTVFIGGPAATDPITGINGYTFRSGRQTLQDVATAGSFLTDLEGSNILVLAQDTAFGAGNVAAVESVLGAKGANVDSLKVPEGATEFTPFAQQLIDADPDLLFVAWAGETTGAMWQALDQQGVFDALTVTTGLANEATFGAYGDAGTGISFLNHYFAGAGNNPVEDAMIELLEASGGTADIFSPDGFNAALMIVHALEEGAVTPDAVVAALEGWSFDGPKGPMQIRASDHALIQPMFRVKLTNEGGEWVPELIGTASGDEVAPPEAG